MATPEKTVGTKNTSSNLKSPTEGLGFFRKNQYWKRSLTNNDFLLLYNRGAAAYKAANKISNDLFDNAFKTENSAFQTLIGDFNLHNINRYTYKNAYISGYCLIFIGYGDDDYASPAPSNKKPEYFYVIPRAWVSQDKYHDGKVEDHYKIYEADGKSFDVHESRIIRFQRNDTSLSAYEPGYNALFVTDNILWSVGQTIWRVGQGFPHISIENPEMIDFDGDLISEVDVVKKQGTLRDINSETGFISDARYKLEFKGADGVAIKPKEYYDIAFNEVCMALEIPKQIMEGTNAGAITGSETNLKDYYSDISSKQKREVQPLYVFEASLFGLSITPEDFLWQPLFEQTQKEKADVLKLEVESYEKLINVGVLSSEQVFTLLQNEYEELAEFTYENPEPAPKNNSFSDANDALNIGVNQKVNGQFPKGKFRDKTVEFTKQDPKWVRLEKQYLKRMIQKFNATKEIITGILVGYNTDAVTENTFKPIMTRVGRVMATEKTVYQDIINRFIDSSFVQGAEKAYNDLNLNSSLIDFDKGKKAKEILQGNAIEIQQSLMDDIQKEISLLLTDISLNNIPISNKEFKEEIQSIFNKKLGRLESGVVTETSRSRGNGLEFGFKQSGLVTHKIWRSVIDDKTTDICRHLNGEIAEVGKPFSTGDFANPAHINCRSTVEPITLTPTQLKQFKQ